MSEGELNAGKPEDGAGRVSVTLSRLISRDGRWPIVGSVLILEFGELLAYIEEHKIRQGQTFPSSEAPAPCYSRVGVRKIVADFHWIHRAR